MENTKQAQLEIFFFQQIEELEKKLSKERANFARLRAAGITNFQIEESRYIIDNIKQNIQYWECELRIYRGEETAAGR